jgi:hypothetical protein
MQQKNPGLKTLHVTILALALIGWGGMAGRAEQPVPLKAHPFALSDVKLLDGPFKHAMNLDHEYLLKLEPDRFLAWFRKEADSNRRRKCMAGGKRRASQGTAWATTFRPVL